MRVLNDSKIRLIGLLLMVTMVAAACSDDDGDPAVSSGDPTTTTTAADDGATEASVAFAAPADGDVVAQRFDVAMTASGFTVEPSGEVNDGAGHFHVMVDTDCVAVGETVPSDESHLHFGKAQTATQLLLDPGEHTLCLQAADGEHTALDLTDEITVTVDGDLPFVSLGLPEGDDLTSPLAVTFEASGLEVAAVADEVDGAVHFHVVVDGDCVAEGEVIPSDDTHLHFGDGSTATDLELEAGDHTLCLQVGDNTHTALAPVHVVSVTIA